MRQRRNNIRNQELIKEAKISIKLSEFAELLEKPRSPLGITPWPPDFRDPQIGNHSHI